MSFIKNRKKMMKEAEKMLPPGMRAELKTRQTGKSTGIALETIGWCMRNPGTSVKIIDHYPTRQSNKYLAETIMVIIRKLELDGFTLNKLDLTLKYSLD